MQQMAQQSVCGDKLTCTGNGIDSLVPQCHCLFERNTVLLSDFTSSW